LGYYHDKKGKVPFTFARKSVI
jgi:hypothetical protein